MQTLINNVAKDKKYNIKNIEKMHRGIILNAWGAELGIAINNHSKQQIR